MVFMSAFDEVELGPAWVGEDCTNDRWVTVDTGPKVGLGVIGKAFDCVESGVTGRVTLRVRAKVSGKMLYDERTLVWVCSVGFPGLKYSSACNSLCVITTGMTRFPLG